METEEGRQKHKTRLRQEAAEKLNEYRREITQFFRDILDGSEDKLEENLRKIPFNNSQIQTAFKIRRENQHLNFNLRRGDNFPNFKQENTPFCDKSIFIRDILQPEYEVVFILRPRRWGKSLNLNMLKEFLTPSNCEEKLRKFRDLKIYSVERGAYMENYYGQVPVIHLNLNNVNFTSDNSIEEGIKTALQKTYKEHERVYMELIKKEIIAIKEANENLSEGQMDDLSQNLNKIILEGDCERLEIRSNSLYNQYQLEQTRKVRDFQKYLKKVDLNEEDLKCSLHRLSEILYYHHGKTKPYILIDEIDKPINGILSRKYENIFTSKNTYEKELIEDKRLKIISMIGQNATRKNLFVKR